MAWLTRGWFVAVDPGTDHPAAAVFELGHLVVASRVKIPTVKFRALEPAERARMIAKSIVGWLPESFRVREAQAVVTEWPQIYTARHSKGNPNGLLPLAAIGAAVAAYLDVPAVSPVPHEWIGNIPKDEKLKNAWDSPRGRLIWGRLRESERPQVENTHDAVDAVGLGLFGLGRLERVFPGAV